MYKFFVSYSQVDSLSADAICAELDRLNLSYFRDIKDISWGDNIDEQISDNLISCSALLVILTPNSIKSEWVPYEIGYGTALSKPVLIYSTQKGMALPSYINKKRFLTDKYELVSYLSDHNKLEKILSINTKGINYKLENLYLKWWEQQNETKETVSVNFHGIDIIVDRRVFSPALKLTYSSYFASVFLSQLEGKKVLDLGTGCGILTILAAKRGASKIVAIDNDLAAIENTRRNLNKFRHLKKRVIVLKGDLFNPLHSNKIETKFDYIFANLPIAINTSFWKNHSVDFRKVYNEFFSQLDNYLENNGTVYLTWASFGEKEFIINLAIKYYYDFRIHKEETFGVTWEVYELSKSKRGRTLDKK